MNFKKKLTSRKFWAAVIGFVTAIITAFKIPNITAEQAQLVLGALATLISYIVGEGMVDKNFTSKNIDKEPKSIFEEVDKNE